MQGQAGLPATNPGSTSILDSSGPLPAWERRTGTLPPLLCSPPPPQLGYPKEGRNQPLGKPAETEPKEDMGPLLGGEPQQHAGALCSTVGRLPFHLRTVCHTQAPTPQLLFPIHHLFDRVANISVEFPSSLSPLPGEKVGGRGPGAETPLEAQAGLERRESKRRSTHGLIACVPYSPGRGAVGGHL